MNYAYQRTGGPIINWNRGAAPGNYRAGDAKALGCDCHGKKSMGDAFRTGAPEAIGSVSAFVEENRSWLGLVAIGGVAYWLLNKKK